MVITSVCLFFAIMVYDRSIPDVMNAILNIFAWGFLLHSIVLGVIAINRTKVAINRSPELNGRGMAIASVVLGCAMFGFLIFGAIYYSC